MVTNYRFVASGLACLLFAVLTGFASAAQEATSYGLADCLRFGLEHNNQLRQAHHDALLAGEQVVTLRGRYEPTLGLSASHTDSELPASSVLVGSGSEQTELVGRIGKSLYTGTTLGLESSLSRFSFNQEGRVETRSADAVHSFSMAVTLDQALWKNAWGRSDRARVNAVETLFEAATHAYHRQKETVAKNIMDAYWRAYAADRLHEVNEQALERARHLFSVNQKKVDDGLMDETDLLAAEASLATVEVDVIDRRDHALNARDELKALISLPHAQWDATKIVFSLLGSLGVFTDEIHFIEAYEAALSNRWDRASLLKRRVGVEEELVLAIQSGKPDLRLQGSLGWGDTAGSYSDSIGFDKTVWRIGLALQVPWFRSSEKSVIRQKTLDLDQLDNDIVALERAIELACRRAVRRVESAAERMRATRKAADLHARKFTAEEKKLLQGRSATQIFVRYQDDLAFAESTHVISISTYQSALTDLLYVQGNLLGSEL